MQQVAEIQTPRGSHLAGERVFADLLRPLIEPGFRLALAMLHDRGAAEDAVQEASFTAWRKLATMRDQGRLRPWFLGVVANKCRNARRQKWTSGVSIGVPEELTVVSGEDSEIGNDEYLRFFCGEGCAQMGRGFSADLRQMATAKEVRLLGFHHAARGAAVSGGFLYTTGTGNKQ